MGMLSPQEIEKIERKALEQRKANDLGDVSPIGENIFNIIENVYKSKILLYPLNTKKVAGFTRKKSDNIQIFINTSFELSFQVFVAAHELFHLLEFNEKSLDSFIVCNNLDVSENLDTSVPTIDELKANYFAAAFLLPASVVKDRFNNIRSNSFIEENIVLEIIKLQCEFEIPYRTIAKRLKELKLIVDSEYSSLLEYEQKASDYHKMMDSEILNQIHRLLSPSNRKYHSVNVPKLAFDAYRSDKITINKMDNIISKYDKKLEDFKISNSDIEPIDIDFSTYGTGDDEDDED
jgi:Zn-dependent peptidase ImmA (M78 family)